uniref:Late embryogenesis abundant n=1 Tax=Cleistogenes songorica TaxID=121774 RepID=A0A2S1WM14_9POAL|nr:late embryogenesis abundant [Cleistogenes songorica]
MQGGKSASAVESAKEAAANVGASAWAGKEKTKAVVQEKVAKARAHDPGEKAAMDARMQERVREVEAAKQDAMRRHAAAKERATAAVHQPTLPEPPARVTVDGRDAAPLSGAHLVGNDDGAPVSSATEAGAAGGHVTGATPNATETRVAATSGHVAGAPETTAAARPDGAAVVNDAARAGTTDGYPTTAGGHHP